MRDAVEKRLPPDEVFEPEIDIDIDIDSDIQQNIFDTPQVSPGNKIFHQDTFIPQYPSPSFLKTQYVVQKTVYNPFLRFQTFVGGFPEPYRSDNFYQQLLTSPRARNLKLVENGIKIISVVDLFYLTKFFLGYLQRNDKKVVCYYESEANHRREPLAFYPEDIDPFACTHLIYAFATIDPHTYELISRDEEYDVIQGNVMLKLFLRELLFVFL